MENVQVMCNAELHEYARELRDQGKHDMLYDVAENCYHHAHDKMAVDDAELEEPSMQMNDDALYDNVMHNCMAGARQAALGHYDSGESAHSGASHGGAHVEQVRDAHQMARKVIMAQKMHDMPESHEATAARKKGISWHMQADGKQVRVTRSRVGGTTTCYAYQCPSEKEFVKLVRATQHERDHVLRKGHF